MLTLLVRVPIEKPHACRIRLTLINVCSEASMHMLRKDQETGMSLAKLKYLLLV